MACGDPGSCLCFIGQAPISHACLATRVWASLLLALFHMHAHTASALRRCHSRSARFHSSTDCRPSPPGVDTSICSSSSSSPDYFPYLPDCRFYLCCPGPTLRPLLCPCPLPDMFFDSITGHCHLATLLTPQTACHHHPRPTPRRYGASRGKASSPNHQQLLQLLLELGPYKRTMPYYRSLSLRGGNIKPVGTGSEIITHYGRVNMTFTNEGEPLQGLSVGVPAGVMDDNVSTSEEGGKWDSKGETIGTPAKGRKPAPSRPGYTIIGDDDGGTETTTSTGPQDHSVKSTDNKDTGPEIRFGSRPDMSDPSIVPAWAIAAIVLCVVITLVALIMFFY